MNIILWVIQILLAFVFIYHGWMMWFLPPQARKGGQMDYVEAIPTGLRRFTAVAESLGGIGLILPWLTGILSWLTPLAAVGLILVMIGAVIVHIPRKEYPNIVFNLVLLALAVFIAYGHLVVVPFSK
jgi:uncharacterized membrane protein YphA (DoxX/SURF4 family)